MRKYKVKISIRVSKMVSKLGACETITLARLSPLFMRQSTDRRDNAGQRQYFYFNNERFRAVMGE